MLRYRMPMPTIEHDKSNMTTLCLDRCVWHLAAPRPDRDRFAGQTISTYRHVLKCKSPRTSPEAYINLLIPDCDVGLS